MSMAEPEEILKLFDSYWFEHKIFAPKQFLPIPKSIPVSKSNPTPKSNEEKNPQLTKSVPIPIPQTEKIELKIPNKKTVKERRRKHGRNRGKSLSELKIEELKGFKDLGFVFSDEDRDSSLVCVIPGLQKQGIRVIENGGSRPYLSESWDFSENIDNYNSLLVNWKIPDIGSEIDMKDNLRVWAHSVASAVR